MAVARVPAIMPHVSSSGGGDDLGSEDEVKVFKDEGEEEKRSSENLTEDKSDLIDLTESEVRISSSPRTWPTWLIFLLLRFCVSCFAISPFRHFAISVPPNYFCCRRTRSIKCVHVCCRKRARSPVGPMRRREKRRRDPTSVPFSVSLLDLSSLTSGAGISSAALLRSRRYVSSPSVSVFCAVNRCDVKNRESPTMVAFVEQRISSHDIPRTTRENHIDANFARVA